MSSEYKDFFKVFSQVSKAIHSGDSTAEILHNIVRNIKEILKAKGCIYWIVDQRRERIVTMVSDGFPYRSLANVNYQELNQIFKSEAGPLVYIENAKTDPRIPDRDTIGKRSVGSISGMFFDIIGDYSGILAVYFYGQKQLSVEETEILTALGEQGAIALHKAFSYDEKMLQSLRQMVEGFTLALEAKDESTHGHSVRVARFARAVAEELGLNDGDIETIYHGGLLHDIGKIGMNDDILERLGILSRKEMDIVKQHPEIGARIAKPLNFLNDVVPLIRHHHERFDGSGYPDGLKASAIPLGARILSLCDAFETMLAGRTHFARIKLEDAIVNLHQEAGSHFDPHLVDVLFSVLYERPEVFEVTINGSERSCLASYRQKMKMVGAALQQQMFI
jgi:putative nucleotidyltransferase with HDIG domain